MKNEIKEILDDLKFTNNDVMWCDKITLDVEQSHLLLDYITNLQQENERLKLELSGYREAILRNDKLLGLQDYKFRCEKAIEYIGNNTHYYSTTKHGEGFVIDNENEEEFCNDLLNILQNGDGE